MKRASKISVGEYYHVYNRGVEKRDIFLDTRDYARFLFAVLYFQSEVIFTNLGDYVRRYIKHRMFNVADTTRNEVCGARTVELINFCMMPNHFHLTLKENLEGGISRYLQRIQNSYTKYFNTRRTREGHLFQGSFRAVHVENNDLLLYLSTYIHRNPSELQRWRRNWEAYPWSSCSDYVQENRWDGLLSPEIILDQFPAREYGRFVRSSIAKTTLHKDLLADAEP